MCKPGNSLVLQEMLATLVLDSHNKALKLWKINIFLFSSLTENYSEIFLYDYFFLHAYIVLCQVSWLEK